MGQSVEDLMTEEQIEKLLVATFNKFDKDGSGKLEYQEFKSAFEDLGLSGTERELKESFNKVDVDGSGFVDRVEFASALKDSRSSELSLNVLMQNMEGQLAGMSDIFDDYKRKLEAAKKQSGADLKISEENLARFQAATKRRRILKKKNEAAISELVTKLGAQLSEMTGKSNDVGNAKERTTYQTLKDTFNAFDRDGSGQLGWSEYLEAWRFIDQPGTDADVKLAFDGVDVDNCGNVDWE